jgi:hypothetical protein
MAIVVKDCGLCSYQDHHVLTYDPTHWSQFGQEYPLDLSISISGGKETNKDSLSNGE